MDKHGDVFVSAKRALLDDAAHKRDVTFQMPAVISHRLDQLVQLLEVDTTDEAGNAIKQRTTTRKELISALVFGAPTDRADLEEVLGRYRDGTAGQAMIPQRTAGRIRLPGRPPGLRLTTDQQRAKVERGTAPRRQRYGSVPAST